MTRPSSGTLPYDGSVAVPGGVVEPVERVIVIGAGMAGVAVANALTHAGVECVVLEARPRLGGRIRTVDVGGLKVDLGASWIHTPHGNPMSTLADQVGIGRVPGDFLDEAVFWDPATGRLDADEGARLRVAYEKFLTALDELRSTLGSQVSLASAVDGYVAKTALAASSREHLRHLLRLFAEGETSGPLERVAARWFPPNSLDYEGSPLGDFPVGGYESLVGALSAGLNVRTASPVREVGYGGGEVRVALTSGEIEECSHVVVTVPLGVLKNGSIRFQPELPAERLAAIARLGFGRFEKVVLRFERAFWTERNLPHIAPVPSDGRKEFALLLGMDRFFGEPVVVALAFGSCAGLICDSSGDLAAARVVDLLKSATGVSDCEPTEVVRSDWCRDPWTAGAYTYVPVGGSRQDLDRLGDPIGGRLLFAGEATTSQRVGYADGALSSGVREAKRLLGVSHVDLGRLR